MTVKKSEEIVQYPDAYHESGSIAYYEKIAIGNILLICRPKLIVETGLYKGYTHRFIIDFLRLNGLAGCRVVSFDYPDVVASLLQDRQFYESSPQSELIGGALPASLGDFLRTCIEPVDFAVIDADHTYRGVLRDMKMIVPRLRPGGYVFCHDYRPNDPKYAGLVAAVDSYCYINGLNILPLLPNEEVNTDDLWGAAIIHKPLRSPSSWKVGLRLVLTKMKSGFKRHPSS